MRSTSCYFAGRMTCLDESAARRGLSCGSGNVSPQGRTRDVDLIIIRARAMVYTARNSPSFEVVYCHHVTFFRRIYLTIDAALSRHRVGVKSRKRVWCVLHIVLGFEYDSAMIFQHILSGIPMITA